MYENKVILIVDDEENSRLYLANILLELFPEMHVQFASTPQEALFLISKNTFDTIFMDVEMPEMTGHELMQKIREMQNLTPVIFVSAFSNDTYLRKALRLSAVDYLDKPVNPKELENAIQKSLNKAPVKKQNGNGNNNRIRLLTRSGDILYNPYEIVCFFVEGRYTNMHLITGEIVLLRNNLNHLLQKIPDDTFIRVSRQVIVNTRLIRNVSKNNKVITLEWEDNQLTINKIFPSVLKKLFS